LEEQEDASKTAAKAVSGTVPGLSSVTGSLNEVQGALTALKGVQDGIDSNRMQLLGPTSLASVISATAANNDAYAAVSGMRPQNSGALNPATFNGPDLQYQVQCNIVWHCKSGLSSIISLP
jgi:hypothetical protein